MRARRLLASLVAVACLAAGGTSPAPAAPAQRLGASRAVVIVDTGGGVQRVVISFGGQVSGVQALQLAGAGPVTVNYGGSLGQAVCKLYGVGNEPVPGQCPGYPYWAYHRAPGGAGGWSYSGSGPSNTVVRDGDVEGWKFGSGGPPPFSSFCAVAGCAPPPSPPPPPPPPGPPDAPGSPPGGGTGATGGVIPPVPIPPEVAEAATSTTGAPRGDEAGEESEAASDRDGDDRTGRDQREVETQLASDADGGGGGPPVSLLAFAAVMAALASGVVVARRARRRPAAPTP